MGRRGQELYDRQIALLVETDDYDLDRDGPTAIRRLSAMV
jgi:hypothetical protein